MKEKKKLVWMLCGLILIIALTGCGAGGNSSKNETSAAEDAASTAATEEEPAAEPEASVLSAYTPVDPASVAECAETDFTFEQNGDDSVTITGYTGTASQVKIPATLGGCDNITISKDAFQDNTSITYLYLPASIKSADSYAFSGCTALEEVVVYGPKNLSEAMFKECTSLRRVELGEGIEDLQGGMVSGTFEECTSLTEILFPSTLYVIHTNAFKGCSALETVDLSQTQVTMIGQLAFGKCSSLRSVTLPPVLKGGDYGLSSNAFLYDLKLAEFIIPEGLTAYEVEDGVLYSSEYDKWIAMVGLPGLGLEEMTIREGTVEIASHAFSNNSFKSLVLPDSLKEINRCAFEENRSLETVTFGSGLELLAQYAFSYCGSLREVILPDTELEIVSSAFSNCYNLEKVSIPDKAYYAGDATTESIFFGAQNAVFTYKGNEYTYDQISEIDAAMVMGTP